MICTPHLLKNKKQPPTWLHPLQGILHVSSLLRPRSISDVQKVKVTLPKDNLSQQSNLPKPPQVTNWPLIDFNQQLCLLFANTSSLLHFKKKFPLYTEHTTRKLWQRKQQQLNLWRLPFCCHLAKGSKAFWRSHFSTGPCGITLCPERCEIFAKWYGPHASSCPTECLITYTVCYTPRGMSER